MRTARVELLNALQADPEDKAARVMQARVDLALGDGVAAESEIVRARQSGVPPGETAHLLAHAELLQGDARAALRRGGRRRAEHEAYAARIRGRAYMALGDSGNALAAFNRALVLAPDDSGVWTDVARFRRSNGDVAGALEAADRAVAARPRNAEALVLRGVLTRGQYGLAAAIPWFDRALDVDGGNVEALIERAITYGDIGRMSDMLADAREVHRLTGGHPTAYYLEAVLAARARNFALARSLWDRTRRRLRRHARPGACSSRAIDFETGNEEQAARRLAGLVADQPGNRRARRLLAAAQWRMGDAAATVATLRPIADRPDADSYSLSLIGRALAALGDAPGAAIYLARAARPQPGALAALDPLGEGDFAAVRRAAERGSGDGPAQVRLISALLARGQTDEALARARRLQADNPGAPEVHILVGDALGVRGDFAAAAEQYRRAANLAFSEAVAMRLIDSLQRSGQAEAADNVLNLFVQQNPRSVPGLILLGGRAMQAAATGCSRSRSTRGCARASATMTRPSSTISPGPIRKAATIAARAAARPPRLGARPRQSGDRRHVGLAAVQERPPRRRPGLLAAGRARRAERFRHPPAPGLGAARLAASAQASGCRGSARRSGSRSRWPGSRRSRSRNCEASPTMTMVAPSGPSSVRRRGLRLGRGHRQHRALVADELGRIDAAQDIGGDELGEARRGLDVAAEIAGQRGAARVELGGRDRLGAEPAHLGEDQAEHFGGGIVAGLGRGDERARLAARVEAAARAVGEAAADADLLVQPRAVAAAEHRIGDERAVEARDRGGRAPLRATATAAWPAPGMSMTITSVRGAGRGAGGVRRRAPRRRASRRNGARPARAPRPGRCRRRK